MSSAKVESKKFELGPQPTWAGREENGEFDDSFIEQLLKEDIAQQLVCRGYCIVDLNKFDESICELYNNFHLSIEKFFQMPREYKEKYAMLQFDNELNSPNQCHGYSEVSTLKEQFMMRCVGYPSNKLTNNFENESTKVSIDSNNLLFPNKCDQFGLNGMKIYEKLDLLCRELEYKTMHLLNKKKSIVDDILDPIYKVDDISNINNKYSNFMPNGYISSSIMDNFHYYEPSSEKEHRFYNNHASHTDSGLMTVVIVTDEPGLEIFDQKLKKWIAIEEVFHKYCEKFTNKDNSKKENKYHRRFATCFWSDSVEYLNNAKTMDKKESKMQLKPLFHRVKGCDKERYSVVFKQRTAPLRTHCRYQEDYVLASIQSIVDKDSKNAYTLWQEQEKQEKKKAFGWEMVFCWKLLILCVSFAVVAWVMYQIVD